MLWIQTSYQFISLYKQRIAALDRAIHGNSRQQHQPQQAQGQQGGQQPPRQHGGHGVVEYRKLLQRFRQFLADEEKFWIQLIVRIRRIFQLEDTQPVLAELGILPDDDGVPADGAAPKRNHFQFPSDADVEAAAPSLTPTTREQRESRMSILSKALVCLGDIERYKEQYNEAGGRPRAGHEDGPPAVNPNNQKGGRGRKGGAAPPNGAPPLLARLRDYQKARQCYQQARILLPQDGNPAHQMAILASYQKDTFGSLVHYYRALCVRTPYDTAADNLGTVLTKALDAWRSRGAKKEKEREKEHLRGELPSMAPRLRVEAFKEKLIVLHALWRISPDEADTIAPNLSQKIAEEFKALVSDRVLPHDIIMTAIILAQGALWKHRMFRNSSSGSHRRSIPAAVTATVESSIAAHLLTMHRVLLEVGIVQIAEAPPEDAAEHDLAQRITAEFRRTLPALRIGSKWLRANLRYLAQAWQQYTANGTTADTPSPSKPKGRDRRRDSDRRSSGPPTTPTMPGLPEFWRSYAQFATALWRMFPQQKLPKLVTTLDEDIEMAGFLPLKKFVPSEVVGAATASKDVPVDDRNGGPAKMKTLQPEQVHPNEEQLMRIADLLADAQALARDEICPLNVFEGNFSVEGTYYPPAADRRPAQKICPPPTQPQAQAVREPARQHVPLKEPPQFLPHLTYEPRGMDRDDDNMTDITRTEDDPVDAAFRKALGPPTDAGDDDEEDEIVWEPRAAPVPPPISRDPVVVAAPKSVPPPAISPPRPHVSSPVAPALSPRSPPSRSPNFAPKRSVDLTPPSGLPPSVTTAQDILANVLHPPKGDLARSLHARQASSPPAHMLFGSNPLGGGPSIWSSSESDGLGFQGAAGTTSGPSYPSYQLQSQSQIAHTQSPAYPLQSTLSLGHGSVPLGTSRSYNGLPPVGHSHQRVQSLSLGRSPMFPLSQGQELYSSSQSQHQSQNQSQPLPDGFGSYPALTEHSAVAYSTGVPAAYADPVYSRKIDAGFLHQGTMGYADRSLPYHVDARTNGSQPGPYPALSSMAQLWNNGG
ncbi:Protein SMG7 [Trametes pubescens]|uniref:Protein SMG7 n=1 Tax=Trametes pubescens TaxID=154538 RepID=A0A1M2VR61_TRAPU|nr:Protein SMG7 [Trametes pubescens]